MAEWDRDPRLVRVLESAARLQAIVPDAVLVGGSAAAFHAGHRTSLDHDHVLADLSDRFDLVLGALERERDWVTNRVTPGKLVLGQLGDIEAGVRQLIRRTPLETQEVVLPSGRSVVVPTPEETLRVKAFLIVKRNQVRDYLDVAALIDRYGVDGAAATLRGIDDYYAGQAAGDDSVASQVLRQLGNPRPKDATTLGRLADYKGLAARWQDWGEVVAVCREVAARMMLED